MRVIHGTLEALKVWQALCFRDISLKKTRKADFSRRDSKGIWETRRTPTVARFLHPLLPDPPPILLKHVTKTSIAVPALPVINKIHRKSSLGASKLQASMLPGLQDPVLVGVTRLQDFYKARTPVYSSCNPVGPTPGPWNPGNAHRSTQDHIKSMKSIQNQA